MFKIFQHKVVFVLAGTLVTGATVGVIVALILAGGTSEAWTAQGSPVSLGQNQLVGNAIPEPRSIKELVNRSNAIVVGRIGQMIRTEQIGPNGDLSKYPSGVPLPLLDFTYYEINIEEVILDDGFIQLDPVLSLPGITDNHGTLGFPMELSSTDQYLFVLDRNPDNQSYGLVGYTGLLSLDGSNVSLADQGRTRPDFAPGMNPSEFIEAVKVAKATRKYIPPSEWRRTIVLPELPKHPLEDIGVAGLTESAGMPENAISQSVAIDIATEKTWGPYRDELQETYPAAVAPAVYNAEKSAMGPAAEGRDVWVVTLQGWGPAIPCGAPVLPQEPATEGDCIPGQSNTYYIIDAVSGKLLAGWSYGERGDQ